MKFCLCSCDIQSKAFDKSVKRVLDVPILSRIFLTFLIMAVRAYWVLYFCENHTEILIRPSLLFGLFCYKWDAHKFLKAKVRYSPVSSWFYQYGFLWQEYLVFFNWSGNFLSMMHWLKFRKIKLVKITVLSLVILKGVSSDSANFEVSKLLLILFSIFS